MSKWSDNTRRQAPPSRGNSDKAPLWARAMRSAIAGRFGEFTGAFGPRRIPVNIAHSAWA